AMATKVKRSTFAITLKESEKTPKYRNYMKRENLNLVCPAKCHPLQLETPERGVEDRENCEILKLPEKGVKINLKIPAKCHTLQLETSGLRHLDVPRCPPSLLKGKAKSCMSCQMPPVTARDSVEGAFYAPRSWLQSEKEHFCDNFKGIEKTPKYRNYMKRENLNLVCPAKCHPLQLETPERARCTPLGVDLKVYKQL
ncbi:hypothetical protein Fcan01_28587, partial [Folsomia candida]